jgi:hypothetical protein
MGLAACKAGPSAFDDSSSESASMGALAADTAPVSELGEIPRAPDVEGDDSTGAAGTVVAATVGDQPEATSPSAETDASEAAGPMGGHGGTEPPAVGSGSDEGSATVDSSGEESGADGGRLVFDRPEHVRGLYLNAWAAGSSRRVSDLLEIARKTEINTFVIDIKDATGYVSHHTQVPMAKEIGADQEIRIRDLHGLLERLHEAHIYPIARIVVVKDPLLSQAHPELAVQDTAGGVWIDSKNIIWLNPFNPGVWDYHLAIAREVAEMGFPEIQWDYVRFPDAPQSDLDRAVFPGADGREKPEAIRAFLDYTRTELAKDDARVTADVFGVTTSATRDVGIGQVWEQFIDVVDVAQPMVYPSHYWKGSFGYDEPNAFPYEIVKRALQDALRRSDAVEGAGATRPWLQDFTLGKPRYEAPEVRAQIQAAYDVGIQEWILWNPGSSYTVDALEPVDGFRSEPEIRVADQVVPVSERWAVLESEEAVPVEEGETAEESEEEAAPEVHPAPADSLLVSDTVSVYSLMSGARAPG